MISFKGTLFYIIISSDLVYSQKSRLITEAGGLSEEKVKELKQALVMIPSSEKITHLASFFGINNLMFNEDKNESNKFGDRKNGI